MLQVRMCSSKRILEIGTLGGCNAGWLATVPKDTKVATLQIDEQYPAVAARNLGSAGLDRQTEIITGEALVSLSQLLGKVSRKERRPFDFVFIEANKQGNMAYSNLILSSTTSYAAIIVDNVVRNGKVALASEANKTTGP